MPRKTQQTPTLVVTSRIKDLVKGADLRSSPEFINGLSNLVKTTVTTAVERLQKDGGRKTLTAQDVETHEPVAA